VWTCRGIAAFQQQEISMKDENRIERFTTHWQRNFKDEPYYSEKYSWEDFDPAYRYAYKSYEENPHARFEDLETRLEAGWDIAKGKSKLAWADAKQAMRSAWNSVERVIPGDSDRDGR
jgi:hypothetical protein